MREVHDGGVDHATLVASLSATLKRLAPTLDALDASVRGTEQQADGARQAP
ncbi:hypothetical protein QPK32_15175 [Massilia sp. YIM B02763]|uniref:hypothetical protein n=1 Tax=Massilia sp. YIM B02763 TaxID=3050130 RepID=UPI0025B6E97F|nr:hypothetical protein [Massilia sp. YIM B02763]MDN4054423.1 hypothetical protein [Massilia sp. YIM B02763]